MGQDCAALRTCSRLHTCSDWRTARCIWGAYCSELSGLPPRALSSRRPEPKRVPRGRISLFQGAEEDESANMVQRLTYRRRHSYATKSNKQRVLRTPGALARHGKQLDVRKGRAACHASPSCRRGKPGRSSCPQHCILSTRLLPGPPCRRQADPAGRQEENHASHVPHLRPAPARGEHRAGKA